MHKEQSTRNVHEVGGGKEDKGEKQESEKHSNREKGIKDMRRGYGREGKEAEGRGKGKGGGKGRGANVT